MGNRPGKPRIGVVLACHAPQRRGQLVETTLDLHKRLNVAALPQEKTHIQRQITAADRQIDQLIYELYDLTPEEIQIVEEAVKWSSINRFLDLPPACIKFQSLSIWVRQPMEIVKTTKKIPKSRKVVLNIPENFKTGQVVELTVSIEETSPNSGIINTQKSGWISQSGQKRMPF